MEPTKSERIQNMFFSQLSLMFHKRSFKFSFSVMLMFATLLPTYFFVTGWLGHFTSEQDLSMLLENIKNPYIFYAYSNYLFYMYYFIPVILIFPFPLSYYTEMKCGYNVSCISRKGKKSYFFIKAICCMIGGFIIFFVPSIINILWTLLIIPEAYVSYSLSSAEIESIQMSLIKGDPIPNNLIFSSEHPILSNLRSALMISIFAAVCALSIYTISLYMKKYPYLASFPMILLLLTLYIFDGNSNYSNSIDPLMYACMGYRQCYSSAYFVLFIGIMLLLNFIFIILKSEMDVI